MINLSFMQKGRLDRLGIFLSGVCFIHCLASMILLVLPITASLWDISAESNFHFYMTMAITGVAIITFVFGLMLHRHWPTALVGLFACALLMFATFGHHYWHGSNLIHYLPFLLGSLLLIYSHWNNIRLCRCRPH